MEGTIVHYRQNRHTTTGNQVIINVGCNSREEAEKLVGKKVTWNTGKKDMVGVVASAHGNSGALRVRFDTGMPGQALGQKVKVE